MTEWLAQYTSSSFRIRLVHKYALTSDRASSQLTRHTTADYGVALRRLRRTDRSKVRTASAMLVSNPRRDWAVVTAVITAAATPRRLRVVKSCEPCSTRSDGDRHRMLAVPQTLFEDAE